MFDVLKEVFPVSILRLLNQNKLKQCSKVNNTFLFSKSVRKCSPSSRKKNSENDKSQV